MEYVIGFAVCVACVGGLAFLALAYIVYHLKDAFKAFL